MFFAAKEAVERKARARDERMREEGRKQGRIEGREQGRLEGREQGRIKGREQGRIEGREQGLREILNALERRGVELPPDVVDECLNGFKTESGR